MASQFLAAGARTLLALLPPFAAAYWCLVFAAAFVPRGAPAFGTRVPPSG